MNNTYNVKLWLGNEEPLYRAVEAMAERALQDACDTETHATSARNDAIEALAEKIEELVCEGMPCVEGMWGELIQSLVGTIDFEDIARDTLADRLIWAVYSSDAEDAELFTDEGSAKQCLLDKTCEDNDLEGELARRIGDLQPGSTVYIEGTEYTLGVS